MNLINGIISALTPMNLLYCFLGCAAGTLVGVLPGLGPASTLAILLPLTMYLDPTQSVIMMAGIFYGAMYGGSTTAILVNIPGEAAAVATSIEGFQMTKQGRAGQALWIAAVGSFIAGTLGAVGVSIIGPGLAKYALKFGPPEYFGLVCFSLTALISFSGTSLVRGIGSGLLGFTLAAVGVDPLTGTARFNFGFIGLTRGLDLVPLVVGLFGIAEILVSAEEGIGAIYEGKMGKMTPRGKDLKNGLLASLRGTLLGFPLGMLPGMNVALTTLMSYDLEKRISKYPEKFGTGVIEGVAGPEATNNATCEAGLIPLMALGIPTSPTWAILLAALMIYGLQPGPLLFQSNNQFVWTVIGSLYVGNFILLILNLPLVGVWARISLIPYKYLAPTILGICLIGAYSPRNALFDVWMALAAGILGYIMRKTNWPLAPLILGFILGPMLEKSLRASLSMGGAMILLSRPVPVALYILAIVVVIASMRYLRRVPKAVLDDQSAK